MQKALRLFTWVPLLCLLAAVNGCLIEGPSEVVLTEDLCVWFEEHNTTGTFSARVVCDQYQDQIDKFLKDNKLKPQDIRDVVIVAGFYKTSRLTAGDDWTISASVDVWRQDTQGGPITAGPEEFVEYTTQSLRDTRGPPTMANLVSGGVSIIEDAILDYINGENPIVTVELKDGMVEPTPTEASPLDFKHRLCVTMQVVAWTKVQ